MYSHILIPTDGSALAEQAVTEGIELAARLGASVTILTVVEPFHIVSYAFAGEMAQLDSNIQAYEAAAGARAASVLEAAGARAAAAAVPAETMRVDAVHPSEAIIKVADEKGADLIVMTSHGRRGVAALMLGSQTSRVLTHSKVPVLVLR